jgi:C1A family cysteine protease
LWTDLLLFKFTDDDPVGIQSNCQDNDEFGRRTLSPSLSVESNRNASAQIDSAFSIEHDTYPDSIDWVSRGAVSNVSNQLDCKCSYSFATTAAIEGRLWIRNQHLVPLSAQNLVDCSGSYGNDGCNGGTVHASLTYVKASNGINTDQQYPYKASQQSCSFNASAAIARVAYFVDVPTGNETYLKMTVAAKGPTAVCVDASKVTFQLYGGGVYFDPFCSTVNVNHFMAVVGYDSQNGLCFLFSTLTVQLLIRSSLSPRSRVLVAEELVGRSMGRTRIHEDCSSSEQHVRHCYFGHIRFAIVDKCSKTRI